MPQVKVHNASSSHQAGAFRPGRNTSEPRLLRAAREDSVKLQEACGVSEHQHGSNIEPEVLGLALEGVGAGICRLTAGRMAAQIPIVAATSTPAVARNSKKRPASPSHNSSGGGYGASKKKKLSASGFAQVLSAPSGNKSACAGPRGAENACAGRGRS